MEYLNGGRQVTINDATIDNITQYDVTSKKIYDDTFSFTAMDGSKIQTFIGTQFVLNIKTGRLTSEQYEDLAEALSVDSGQLTCEEFSGAVTISDVSVKLDKCDFYGTYYYVSFTCSQVGVTADPDCL